jgi:DNA-directed RNA polymerase subunit RPC12/RpoP
LKEVNMAVEKYSHKEYKCSRCGHVSKQGTNHWGNIYPKCDNCSWKNPLQPFVKHTCSEDHPVQYLKKKFSNSGLL